jgi:glycosyltransferase involved in cell wall biosynthesis
VKVLQVVPSLGLGGAEHVAAFLASAFAKPDMPALCTFFDGPFAEYLRARRVHYRSFRKQPTWKRRMKSNQTFLNGLDWLQGGLIKRVKSAPSNLIFDVTLPAQRDAITASPGFQDWFAEVVKANDYDVIHFHTLPTAKLFEIAKNAGKRVIYGHHNILSERHNNEDIEFLVKELRWVDHIVCVSQVAREDFRKATSCQSEKVSSIPNPSFLATGSRKKESAMRCIGSASNLEAAKGVDTLLRAWHVLRKKGNCPDLWIAGGKPQTVRYWQEVAINEGVASSVKFLGQLTTEKQMEQFYENVDVILMPSRSEAFPLQAVEAMSRGIPLVASGIPVLREVIGEAGLFFEVGDSEQLAQCVEHLLLEPELRQQLSSIGYNRWITKFSPGLILEQYNHIYMQG